MIHEMLDAPLHAWLNTGGPFCFIKRHIGRCTFEMLSVAKQYDANDNRHEISGTPGGD
jgi:hypothetical protein